MPLKKFLKIWKIPVLWVSLIYSTIPLARPFTDFFQARMNIYWLIYPSAALFLGGAFLLTLKHVKNKTPMTYVSMLLLIVAFVYALLLPSQPAEKIHFFEYAFLSVLIYRGFVRQSGASNHYYLQSFLAAFLVSLGEEELQSLYPGRVGDISDILYNSTGSTLGLLYLLLIHKGKIRSAKPENS